MRATVGTKILTAFGIVVACALGLAAFGVARDRQMESALTRLHDRALVATRAAGDAGRLAALVRAYNFQHAATTDPGQLDAIERQIELHDGQLDRALDELTAAIARNDARLARVRRIQSALAEWRRQRTERFLPVSRGNDADAAMAAMTRDVSPHFLRATQELDELIADTRRTASAEYDAATETLAQARLWTLAGALFTAFLAFVLGLVLSRDIGRRVQVIASSARQVADGTLSERVRVVGVDEIADLATAFNAMASTIERKVQAEVDAADAQRGEREALAHAVDRYGTFVGAVARGELSSGLDEATDIPAVANLGRDLRTMGEALRRMILRVHETVAALSSATADLSATAQQQSASAAQAAAAVTETVTTVDELTQTSRASAERAREVSEAARRSVDASDSGRAAVEQSIAAMERVQAQMSAIAERILGLSEQAQRVGHIVSTVGDLAEQSNLLALNAAIEAARAGEHGRSFAVVAHEVRALAEQSKRATVQVREILGEVEKSTTQAVLVTEQGSKAVAEAVETVREAGGRIDQLSLVIADSAGAASHIAISSEQQVTGVTQIAQAMHSINQASTQSVDATRQTERAARELSSLSDRLRDAVADYHI